MMDIHVQHEFFLHPEPRGFPKIILHPSLRVVPENFYCVMQCSVSGNPAPTVSWIKDFVPVDLSDYRFSLLEGGGLICNSNSGWLYKRNMFLFLKDILSRFCSQTKYHKFLDTWNPLGLYGPPWIVTKSGTPPPPLGRYIIYGRPLSKLPAFFQSTRGRVESSGYRIALMNY